MLRSLLFVPAKNEMLKKIGKTEADGYIIDLEDSVEFGMKEEALKEVQKFLLCYQEKAAIFVRLNARTYKKEAEVLNKYTNVGFMLPKFEAVEYYQSAKAIWDKHRVIALVETPKGIINSDCIAQCEWVDGIAFGAEDYTTVSNMSNESDLLIYQKSCLLTYAKAYGKIVFDTPSFDINCKEMFAKDVNLSVRLGFDGKMAIHPKQVAHINSAFLRVSKEDAKKIIEIYEKNNQAVQVINGKVYEKMHVEHLKKLLKSENKI